MLKNTDLVKNPNLKSPSINVFFFLIRGEQRYPMTLSTAEKKSDTFMNNNICPQDTQSDLIRFVFKKINF